MRFHPCRRTLIDGAHFDPIFEPGGGPFHFTEIFVDGHRLHRGEMGLFALDQVFAFQSLLLLQVLRVLKISIFTKNQHAIATNSAGVTGYPHIR